MVTVSTSRAWIHDVISLTKNAHEVIRTDCERTNSAVNIFRTAAYQTLLANAFTRLDIFDVGVLQVVVGRALYSKCHREVSTLFTRKCVRNSERILVVVDISRRQRLVAAIAVMLLLRKKRRNRKKRIWVRKWVERRPYQGCLSNLVNELRNEDPSMYRNFLRMTEDDFNVLLEKVAPKITKQDTNMREAISAADRLVLTLRFLASCK